MKNFILLILVVVLISCNKQPDQSQQNSKNISLLVKPSQTSSDYKSVEKSHYIVRNNETHLNKLLLFIGGSFSTPKNYNKICDLGASIGLDVISLSYPNNTPASTLSESSDLYVFDNYHEEICFGNPVSNEVDVNNNNSITTRTIKLLEYLQLKYPTQNWGQYLTSSKTLKWNKVIVAGHSQGSGHACYLGKKNNTERVVMFSGPNDFSDFYNKPANWVSLVGLTPIIRHYSLLHQKDQIVAYNNQVETLRKMGLLSATDTPFLVDEKSATFSHSNALSLNIPAISYHNSTIGNNTILPDIWTYMFTYEK